MADRLKASSWRPSATVAALTLFAALAAWTAGHRGAMPESPSVGGPPGGATVRVKHDDRLGATPPESTTLDISDTLRPVPATTDPCEDALRVAVDGIRPDEISEILQWLQAAEPDELTRELSLRLVRSWAESDPRAAAKWTTQLPAGPGRDGALDQVAIAWANHECEAAAQWACQLTETEKQNALGAIAQEVLRTNPVKALQFSTELSSGEVRDHLLRHAVAEWAATDADEAIAWVRQIPDQTLREPLLAAAAVAWSERDPIAASTLVSTQLPAGRLKADSVIGIVQRWAQQDSRQAATWVDSFLDDDLRRTAIETLDTAARHSL